MPRLVGPDVRLMPQSGAGDLRELRSRPQGRTGATAGEPEVLPDGGPKRKRVRSPCREGGLPGPGESSEFAGAPWKPETLHE